MSGTGGHGSFQVDLRVITYPDRPGIARIYSGDSLLFDAADETVTDATVRVAVPFHSHFENASFAVAYREK
jgi:hypothetical protein